MLYSPILSWMTSSIPNLLILSIVNANFLIHFSEFVNEYTDTLCSNLLISIILKSPLIYITNKWKNMEKYKLFATLIADLYWVIILSNEPYYNVSKTILVTFSKHAANGKYLT